MFEELEKQLNLLKKLSEYNFQIEIKNKPLNSILLNMSMEDFFYLYDNGDPTKNIEPHNISTKFEYYIKKEISPKIKEECIKGILYEDWNISKIEDCLNKYCIILKNYLDNQIKNDIINLEMDNKAEFLHLDQLAEALSVKFSN